MRRGLIVLAASLSLAGPAHATEMTVKGAPAPGPSAYDRLAVTTYGPSSARTVLVLVPGTSGGRGDFALIGPELVKRVPGLQVWAADRREDALEDVSGFRGSAQHALDYYLGWIGNSDPVQPHYVPKQDKDFAFVRRWGLTVAMDDLHRVVSAARAGGRRRVILGGHSLGASEALAYATWDFKGRAGHRDLSGLMLIDGGLLGSFDAYGVPQATKALADLRTSSPFLDLLGLHLPWAAGAFAQTGALAAKQDPTAPSTAQSFPLLPAQFKPPIPATNRGLFGYAFDASTSPAALKLIQVRAGALGPDGDWVDGEVSPIGRVAELFAHEPGNAVDWYFPRRLSIDVNGANQLRRNATTKLLGLRTDHLKDLALPTYAFQTSLTEGRVARGARALAKASKIGVKRLTVVDRSRTTSHLDPLTAAPATNDFLKTARTFLRRIG